jgi:hypothetical protein
MFISQWLDPNINPHRRGCFFKEGFRELVFKIRRYFVDEVFWKP